MTHPAAQFIAAHEGCKLTAYLDSAGVWTIGFGATGPDIVQGLVWTQEQADARFDADLTRMENAVRHQFPFALSARQIIALISFAFNLGAGALATSTLRQKINAQDWIGAAREFARWDHAGGHEVKGLLIRRFHEAALFLEGSP